jgi:hypothetical protein
MEKINKRSHFRVEMLIPVKWEILDDEDTEKVKKGLGNTLFKQGGVLSPIEEYLDETVPGSKDEQLYLALQYLNNKLDFIIEQIMAKTEDKSLRHDDIIELSAAGLKFKTLEKIEIGSYLKMELMMPGVIQFGMELIAEVLRVMEDENGNGYVIAARIACIKDDAKDSIVKMVFQKQRSDIRNNRRDQEEVTKID